MTDPFDPARFPNLVLTVDAGLNGPTLRVDEILALRAGSLVMTGRPAGENLVVTAGQAPLGKGELGCFRGTAIVRMLSFGSESRT
jgi:flagellar motor switch/type III secretory pathway protein FliN